MTPKGLEAARKLWASGMTAREIAPAIGVSVATLYRHLPVTTDEASADAAEAATQKRRQVDTQVKSL